MQNYKIFGKSKDLDCSSLFDKQEFSGALHRILNYSVVNYSRQGKPRRLWRLAVATQPPIAEHQSAAVSRGDTYSSETHCKLRRSAAVG